MAWTAPMTAVDNATFTSAQYNTHIRDNLLQTLPAQAATENGYFVTSAANTLVERVIGSHAIATSQTTTTSANYADLTTVGPTVTITTGASAIAWMSCQLANSGVDAFSAAGICLNSGATTPTAMDPISVSSDGIPNAGQSRRFGVSHIFTGLTPGSNTFTMKYRVSSGTGTFSNRELIVMAL